MSDPRDALQATYARWLRVRASVRVLAARISAAELRARHDASRSDDPDMDVLARQLADERDALAKLGQDLDARISEVKRNCAAIEMEHVTSIIAQARLAGRRAKPYHARSDVAPSSLASGDWSP